MVVTDPTIDPITGLPLLNPQDVIQQIPLGVQTFPYEDMQATARPTRNPLYGDDILPVSAFVAGQHPSTGSAQTVGTDGNHRLLVSGEGSSGSINGSIFQGFDINELGGGSRDDTPLVLVTPGMVIHGLQIMWFVEPGVSNGFGLGIGTLASGPTSFNNLWNAQVNYTSSGWPAATPWTGNESVMFPRPVALDTMAFGQVGGFYIEVSTWNIKGSLEGVLYLEQT